MALRVVHPTCAGIDVHKRDLKVCLIWRDAQGQRQEETRTYSTMVDDLERMRTWLEEYGGRVVAIESTGVYWQPVFNILEEADFDVWLVNPAHIQQVEARKTDVKDAAWLAQLLEHGLLKRSFIPPQAIRELRDVARYRRKLVGMRSSEVNRLQKLLEQANIKLTSVLKDVQGVSAQAMLQALLEGEQDPERLAALARGRLRSKQAELARALQGRWRPHHALLLAQLLAHIDYLDESIAQCDAHLEELGRPFEVQLQRLDTITGVGRRAALDLIAEIGVDMTRFRTYKHLCSWARVCPGNRESAGKRKSARTGKGNKWLKAVLVECGQAAGRTKDTYLGALYRRAKRAKGGRHAAIVTGHSILQAAYFILRDQVDYEDLGVDHFDRLKKDRLVHYYARRLGELGIQIPRELLTLPPEAERAEAAVVEPEERAQAAKVAEGVEAPAPSKPAKASKASKAGKAGRVSKASKATKVTQPPETTKIVEAALVT